MIRQKISDMDWQDAMYAWAFWLGASGYSLAEGVILIVAGVAAFFLCPNAVPLIAVLMLLSVLGGWLCLRRGGKIRDRVKALDAKEQPE